MSSSGKKFLEARSVVVELRKESRGMISDSMGKKAVTVSVVAVLGMQWAMKVAKLAA